MNFFYLKEREIRKLKKIRIDAVAAQLGISRATVWLWESGKGKPNEKMTRLLAKALNISVELISDLKVEAITDENIDMSSVSSLLYSFGNTNIIDRRARQMSDIENIKRQFDELNQMTALTATFVNVINLIFYVKDIFLKYVIVNNAFMENLSLNKNYKALGKTDTDFFPKEEARRNIDADKKVISTGLAENTEGYIPGSRKKKWGMISRTPIFDLHGKVTGVLVYITDTTERRELELTQNAMIECMASIAEYKNHETGMHIRRTQVYIRELAISLKNHPKFKDYLDDKTIKIMSQSAPLHDIGEVAVPDSILLKRGKLTDEEFSVIKNHPIYGSETIAKYEKNLPNNALLKSAREISLSHHEKWDGSGYPIGLKEDEIPISGRLMALADVYDALTTNSVYRTARSHEEALVIIQNNKSKHFDPDIVDAFISIESKFKSIADELSDNKRLMNILIES